MPPSDSTGGTPQNVLCIVTDQQRQDSIGAYGNDVVETPNIDALAADGTRFDRGYTPTAICSPARASIVTGVSPTTHGVTRNIRAGTTIDEDYPCYPQLLRDAGYNVGLDGKWHVGKHPSAFGFDGEHYPGFMHPMEHDDYEAYLDEHGFEHWSEEVVEDYPADAEYIIGGVDQRPVEASFTYFIAERTIERIEAYAEDAPETPFYIGSHFFGPHRPYFIPERYFEMYDPEDVHLPESAVKERFEDKPTVQRTRYEKTDLQSLPVEEWRKILAVYYGYVTFIDDQVGRILDALEREGLADDTAVLYTADHGSFVTAHKNLDKGPLMYEDIYNVPFITRGLDLDAESTDAFASLLDLAPTFVDLAGLDVPEVYEGRSLLDLDRESEDWREYITAEFHGLNFPYEQRMLRTDQYKYVMNAGDTSELYDLDADPHELDNKVGDADYADVEERLHAQLSDILRERNDPELPEDEWLYPALTPMYYPTADDEH
jgi:arylsulfatase A-like enzyme